MSRAVVTVKSIPRIGDIFELTSELVAPTVNIDPLPLACAPDDPEFQEFRRQPAGDGVTLAVGRKLFDVLNASPAVAEQLVVAIAQRQPFYIADQSLQAQALPWEALCRSDDGLFLALDGELPLGRMVGRLESKDLSRYLFDPPLRILAILAASGGAVGDTAVGEWEALAGVLTAQADVPHKLMVVGCDDGVRDAVEAAAAAGGPEATFRFLASADTVLEAAQELRPHILHFFCHGVAEIEPLLELATRGDQVRGNDRGSVILGRNHFSELRKKNPSLWLVTLNCCLGAAATDASQPLGRLIVREGVPAVVAMQEPIDRRDAHLFCDRFYRSLLDGLSRSLAAAPPHPLDWASVLHEPRRRLFEEHRQEHGAPADCKEWTLPVVYVHSEPFRLAGRVVAGLDPDRVASLLGERDQLEQVRGDVAKMENPPPTIREVLEGIDARLAAIELELLGGGDGGG